MYRALGILSLLLLSLALVIRLFFGVYIHDEFGDTILFLKHRPTWKWTFYSPIGLSDMWIEDLSAEYQIEQHYFNEFVWDQGLSR